MVRARECEDDSRNTGWKKEESQFSSELIQYQKLCCLSKKIGRRGNRQEEDTVPPSEAGRLLDTGMQLTRSKATKPKLTPAPARREVQDRFLVHGAKLLYRAFVAQMNDRREETRRRRRRCLLSSARRARLLLLLDGGEEGRRRRRSPSVAVLAAAPPSNPDGKARQHRRIEQERITPRLMFVVICDVCSRCTVSST